MLNAGIGEKNDFLTSTDYSHELTLDVDLRAVVTGARLAATAMMNNNQGGNIIALASAAGSCRLGCCCGDDDTCPCCRCCKELQTPIDGCGVICVAASRRKA